MSVPPGFLRRLRLRHAVFLALLLAGIIPLAVSSILLIWQNRDLIRAQKERELLRSAQSLSRELDTYLGDVRQGLEQMGQQLVALAPPRSVMDLFRRPQLEGYLEQFSNDHPEFLTLQLLDPVRRRGRGLAPSNLSEAAKAEMDATVDETLQRQETVFRLVDLPDLDEPAVVVTVPIALNGEGDRSTGEPLIVIAAIVRLQLLDDLFQREAQDDVEIFLLETVQRTDGARAGALGVDAQLLWSGGAGEQSREFLLSSGKGREFALLQGSMVTEYERADGVSLLARVSRVQETGWTVVVQRQAALAFEVVNEMVFNTILSSVILVLLALLISLLAARQVSQPIQKLAVTTHEIADGNFGHRVETSGLLFELGELGEDFNRMSAHVERYIEELKRAAQANRDLFIGSLRAFVAAIDAKDPYTRGHSERVAKVSRLIAKRIGLSSEKQEQIWIAALLHDVGKIGVEDRVLQKVGRLTEEEFEQMKLHPEIGADIITPIEQLRHTLPVIRWHHENWNGKGYPDGLKGEEIPLEARIVAVADTFDAVTTNRPYQQAFTLEFAVETIIKLTGKRFDAKVSTAFLSGYETGEITIDKKPEAGAVPVRSETEVEARVSGMS